jgi:hypothetical protein
MEHRKVLPQTVTIAAAAIFCAAVANGATSSPSQASAPAVSSAASPSAAASPAAELTAAQRRFAAAFVSAANAKDAGAMRKLVTPQSLSCYDKDTEPFLDRWIKTRRDRAVSPDYKASFLPYGGFRRSKFITMPVQPTEMMQIDFATPGGQKMSLFNNVWQENGRYYLVAPCLTAKGAEHFKTDRAKHEERARKAREAYAKLNEPTRSQLADLLKRGKKREAYLLCKRELKVDSSVAIGVLDLVAGREPGRAAAPHSSATSASSRR